jgi:hypothetical protein
VMMRLIGRECAGGSTGTSSMLLIYLWGGISSMSEDNLVEA